MADMMLNAFDVWITAQGVKSKGRVSGIENISLEGIAKLRELILELAVRGKLIPQSNIDEPAFQLFEKIQLQKKELEKLGRIKKQNKYEPITKDEYLFQLPNGWHWARLGEISDTNTGYAFKSTEYTESGTFVLRVTNIKPDGSIDLSDTKYIDPERASTTYEKFILAENDVLLVMVGGTLGKIGVVSKDCLPAVLNQNMWKLYRFGDIPLKFFIAGLRFINRNQLKITSSTHGHLAQGEYLNKLFPLPPLAEQHRIVAKVDELMALCDALEQQENNHLKSHQLLVETLLGTLTQARDATEFQIAWATLAQHFDDLFTTEDSIDQLKQTILQLAVMGKLVKQDPKDEVEISRLGEKTNAFYHVNYNDLPFEIPNSWSWCMLGDLCKYEQGIQIDIDQQSKYEKPGWVRFLRIVDFTQNTNELRYVESPGGKYLIEEDELVMVRYGASAGFVGTGQRGVLANNLFKIKYGASINKSYLIYFFNTNYFNEQLSANTKGVAMPAISFKFLNELNFPLPPVAEQVRIVAKLSELFALCDRLKERIGEAQKVANLMAENV